MERKAILIEGMGAPKRVVKEIQTRFRTTTVCPLCKRRLKKNDPTVLIDLVTRIPLTREKDKPERTVRIRICEPCAQQVIHQRQETMDELVELLPRLAMEDILKKEGGSTAKVQRAGNRLTRSPTGSFSLGMIFRFVLRRSLLCGQQVRLA